MSTAERPSNEALLPSSSDEKVMGYYWLLIWLGVDEKGGGVYTHSLEVTRDIMP